MAVWHGGGKMAIWRMRKMVVGDRVPSLLTPLNSLCMPDPDQGLSSVVVPCGAYNRQVDKCNENDF